MRSSTFGYVWSCGIVVLTTGLLFIVQHTLGLQVANISLGYIVAVLLAAISYGLGPGVVASFLAFVSYNFWFVPPLYTFSVTNPQDLFRLFLFLIVAVLTSSIAARSRNRTEEAQRRARIQETLYRLSQTISAVVAAEAIVPIIAQQSTRLLPIQGCTIQVLDRDVPPLTTEVGAIGSDGTAIVAPLRVGVRTLGVLRVWERPDRPLDADGRQLLQTLAQQAALAVERARLVDETTALQLVAESERLKSALLHSVSHDLRSPLVAIKGAVSNLLDETVAWDRIARHSFLETIDLEADRLNRLVRNLLDMSRIEAGAPLPPKELATLDDVLGPVLHRLKTTLESHPLSVQIPADLPLVPMAVIQVDQILTNLLENAGKYAPPSTPITITAQVREQALHIAIADAGPGIPPAERERIFDKFYRLGQAESAQGGTGLGLAICKYWVEAHGGQIWAEPRPGAGTSFSFTLPLDDQAWRHVAAERSAHDYTSLSRR
ncbi:MAG TPA: ATP-binding protein [Herpetosiphonaceae bacterium]